MRKSALSIFIFLGIAVLLNTEIEAKTQLKKSSQVVARSVILEVSFERKGASHVYKIDKSLNKNSDYELVFIDQKHTKRFKKLSQYQVDQFRGDAVRIIWNNQYRKPSSDRSFAESPCRPYAKLKTEVEETKICYENWESVGKTFGLLNSMNRMFR